MSISKEITRLEHSAVKLTLTVGVEVLRSRYDDLIRDYVKSAAIPGFRKGKVPREVLERKFGESLKEEALHKTINKTITEIFEDENFPKEDRPLPYSGPRLEDEPAPDIDKDLVFSVVYDVLPKVTVGPWKGLEVEIPDVELGDEEISRELNEIRERNAIVLDREDDAAAARDDVVTVNYFELDEDGNPVPGTERQDFVFTLGSGYNLYKIDDDMVGMKKGESRDITKSFPEDYVHKELAGRTLTIRLNLSSLKEKKLPDLDDDLAQDVDEKYRTLEDLKNNIRERLGKNLEKHQRDLTVSKILEKVLETTPIDLPESMVNLELDARFRNLARRFNTNVEDLAKNLSNTGQDPEKIRNEWTPDAEKALRSRLIVETLIEELNLEASEEETAQKVADITAEANNAADAEELQKYYEQDNVWDYLKEDIKEKKLFNLFVAENTIKKGKKESYLDFMSGNR
jgi:trigger factor